MDLVTAAETITTTILDAPNGGPVKVEWLDEKTAMTTGSIAPYGKIATVTVWKDELDGVVFVAKVLQNNRAAQQVTIPPSLLGLDNLVTFAQHTYQVLRHEIETVGRDRRN